MSRRKELEREVARLAAEVAWLREGCDRAVRARDEAVDLAATRGRQLVDIARAAQRIIDASEPRRGAYFTSPVYTTNSGVTR